MLAAATPGGLPGADLYLNIVQVIGLGEGSGDRYGVFHEHNPGFLAEAKTRCEAAAAPP